MTNTKRFFLSIAALGAAAFSTACGDAQPETDATDLHELTVGVERPDLPVPHLISHGCYGGSCTDKANFVVEATHPEVVSMSFNLFPCGSPRRGQRVLVEAETKDSIKQALAIFQVDVALDLELRIRSADANGNYSAYRCLRHDAGTALSLWRDC